MNFGVTVWPGLRKKGGWLGQVLRNRIKFSAGVVGASDYPLYHRPLGVVVFQMTTIFMKTKSSLNFSARWRR